MPTSTELSQKALHVKVRKSFGAFTLDCEFAVPPGFTILFGASGAGKTTLLDCVAGLTAPDAGRIAAGDRLLFDSNEATNIAVRKRNVGYVMQELALFPHLTVEQNVEYGLTALPHRQRRERCASILKEFRIEQLRERRPGQISGGERQRVALARALVTEPRVLSLDEPLAAVDAPTKAKIIDDLRRWNQAHCIPILYVTHSREEVVALGERVLVMEAGRIIAQGTPHEVLRAPRQETVAQLAGFENIFDAVVESIHEERGSMYCRLNACTSGACSSGETGAQSESPLLLETPLIHAEVGAKLRIGVRAGDILLATIQPQGLSARNVIRGRLMSLERRDMIISARVDCGVEMEVYLTLAAQDALRLAPGNEVWLVIKTHSCHLMAR